VARSVHILSGAQCLTHPNKSLALAAIGRVASGSVDAALDAEVLQEIIHRYRALNRWTEGRNVYALARTVFPEVLPITGQIMDRAKTLADADNSLSARDAVHAAVVLVNELDGIYTFDSDSDRIPGIRRIHL